MCAAWSVGGRLVLSAAALEIAALWGLGETPRRSPTLVVVDDDDD